MLVKGASVRTCEGEKMATPIKLLARYPVVLTTCYLVFLSTCFLVYLSLRLVVQQPDERTNR